MSDGGPSKDETAESVSDAALKEAERYVEAEEGATNRLRGVLGAFAVTCAVAMSLFHLYTAYAIVPTHILRPVHVAMVLFLVFLLFPISSRFRDRVMWWDWIAALLPVVIVAYMIHGGDNFTDRNTLPNQWDLALGITLVVLIIEGLRRT